MNKTKGCLIANFATVPEFLRTLNINHSALASIPAHRIARLRRQGERYFTDGLRDITSDRRWAILGSAWNSEIILR
ncbi:hypothetical protein [Enterobacter asburiae]|uniref:hypothetical protein n=1 Tax=Enterobacter asburiae TaxID=61645 RepID=UPI002075CB89|nr:hypothetical protein [Enterobacter asburiae]MCM7649563.1 hypothetical protein [Enterobacter asburiae]